MSSFLDNKPFLPKVKYKLNSLEMLDTYIDIIENQLFAKAIEMQLPTLEEDLGVIVFEATLYRYSQNEVYKKRALLLVNKLIEVFGDREVPSGFLEGFEGVLYVVQYVHKCKIIDNLSLLEDLEEYLFTSIEVDLKSQNFDPLHGAIGKLLYCISSSKNRDRKDIGALLDKLMIALYNSRRESEHGIFWYDEYEQKKEVVNLGIAHGLPGKLTFLIRLKEIGYEHKHLDILIDGMLKSLKCFKNGKPKISMYPGFFSENGGFLNSSSRLGWCSGDLGIGHTLWYAQKVLDKKELQTEVDDIIVSLLKRRIITSGLDHYEEYSFFDNGFCHGISGIVYVLQKMNTEIRDENLTKRISFWTKELLLNLDKQLSIKEDIFLPEYRQDDAYSYVLDKESLLNGLSGVGLVLLSLKYDIYDWSDFFMLFAPGACLENAS